MKYQHVVSYIQEAAWAMLPAKIEELCAVIAHRASGQIFSAEEITARLGSAAGPPPASSSGAIAVIPLRGVIAHRISAMQESSGGMSAERFTAMVRQAAADPAVSAIVLDVDSPGGTVNGVMDAAAAVFEARAQKPVVAIANGLMASAAYWIGSQASEIVALPGLLEPSIGSVGVYAVHQDLSAALEREGVKITVMSAGTHKVDGAPFQPLSDEQRAFIQSNVDAAYAQFVKDVARGRGVSAGDVQTGFGEGRALSAKEAKTAGLVDRLATVDETIARLANPTTRARIGTKAAADEGGVMVADMVSASACGPASGVVAVAAADGISDGEQDRIRRFARF